PARPRAAADLRHQVRDPLPPPHHGPADGRRPRAAPELLLSRAARARPYLERVHRLLARAEMVEPAQAPRVVPNDPEDNKLVAAALAARAILVTNDAHLLTLAGHEGLEVVRPTGLRAH